MKVPENREIIEADNNVSPVQIDYIFVALLLVEWIQRVIRMMQDWGDTPPHFQPFALDLRVRVSRRRAEVKMAPVGH